MNEDLDPTDSEAVLVRLRALVAAGNISLSAHARRYTTERDIGDAEIREAILVGSLLENYPSYHKGACCLIYGDTRAGRPIHLVCSTLLPLLTVITAYEPTPPKWLTPTQRGR